MYHDDVIKWKIFSAYWPFVQGIHRSPVNSPHKGQWRGALMFSLLCAWINGWVNTSEAGDLSRHRAHYDVTVMISLIRGVMIYRKTKYGMYDYLSIPRSQIIYFSYHVEAETKWPSFHRRHISNAFSPIRLVTIRLRFHWSLLPSFQLTIF